MIEPLYLELLRFADRIQGTNFGLGPRLLREHLRTVLARTVGPNDDADHLATVAEAHLGTGDLGDLVWVLETLRSEKPEAHVEAALPACLELMPTTEPRVLLLPGDVKDERTQSTHGVVGYTPRSGLVLLFIAPRGLWDRWLPYALAREFLHSTRLVWFPLERLGNRVSLEDGRPFTLLDRMVFEGLADAFAQTLYSDLRPPWTHLSRSEEKTAWKRLRPRLGQTNITQIQQAMLGDGVTLPLWSGYAIGYWIVQGFRVRYPKATLDDLVHMDARTIFQESGLAH
jgi:uncharacterized protein YjaZ